MQEFFDPRLKHPFTMMVSGPSKAGKTHLIDRILRHWTDSTVGGGRPDAIFVWFQNYQPIYDGWKALAPKVQFHKGIPENEEEAIQLLHPSSTNVLVIDDLDTPSTSAAAGGKDRSDFVAQMFSVYSHHRSTSVIYSTHHLFNQNKRSVIIARNCDYLVLFPSPRDRSSVKRLGFQCKPNNSQFLVSAFEQATTSRPYGFLLCDWLAGTGEDFRFRETISPLEPFLVCYREKSMDEKNEDSSKKHS